MKKLNFSWGQSEIKIKANAFPRIISSPVTPSRNDSKYAALYRSVILAIAGTSFCLSAPLSASAQSSASPPPTPPGPDSNNPGSAPAAAAAPGAATDNSAGVGDLMLPPPTLRALKVNNNEVSASADFMYGEGTVNLPVGFAFNAQFPGGNVQPSVISANRSSEYYGTTVSYSYGRTWYFDFSYEHGTSSGSQTVNIPNTTGPGSFPSNFNINDDLYTFYVRYSFKNLLAGSRFRAYLRAGFSLDYANLTANDQNTPSFYNESDNTTDILGNLGFGLTYSLYSSVKLKVGLQGEGEAFVGNRSQDVSETLPQDNPAVTANTTINNNLYGGIGRITVHGDFLLGESGRWKLAADAGFEYKYTVVTYSGASAPNEELYGPYVKVGLSYLF